MTPGSKDTHPVSTFKRDPSGMMEKMKRSKRPFALTVKGQIKAVLLDPATYEHMADRLDAIECIRCGLAQAKKGLGRPAGELFDKIRARMDGGNPFPQPVS